MDGKKFYDEPFRTLSEMTKDELSDELSNWRNLWSWFDPITKYWITKVGYPIRGLRRDYHPILGTMGQPHFELKSLEIDTVEEEKDYFRKVLTSEVKTVVIPFSQLIDIEFIHSSESVPIDERGDVIGEGLAALEELK